MSRSSNTLLSVAIILLSFGVSGVTSNAYTIDSSGGFVNKPITFNAIVDFSSDSKTAISNGCSQWNNAGSGVLATRGADAPLPSVYYPKKDTLNVITKFSSPKIYVMETARQTIWFGYQIIEADININVRYPLSNNGTPGTYDVGNAVTHEIGHALGLGHSSNTSATMFEGAPTGETQKRTIEIDDKDGVNYIY